MTIHKIKRYTKKALPVNAVQITADNLVELRQWVEGCQVHGERAGIGDVPTVDGISFAVFDVKGIMYGWLGDWVIQGVLGEFYICPGDVFAASYEEAA